MTHLNRAKTVSINEQYFRYNAFYVAVCSASVFPDNSVMGLSSNRLLGLPYGLSAGQMFSTLSGKAAMVLQSLQST